MISAVMMDIDGDEHDDNDDLDYDLSLIHI